ncbi:MAG: YicC family protein [Planctomycetes bacterium]|nr:YicC family protein [Planctomycetota bacterium]
MPNGMTGFGRASLPHALGAVTVEVKSVNNRFLKVSLRLPDAFGEIETELEAIVRQALIRGSVHVNVSLDRGHADVSYTLNEDLIRAWLPRLRALAKEAGSTPPELKDLLAMPGAVLEQSEAVQPQEGLQEVIKQALQQALKGLSEMRAREGESLGRDIEARVSNVAQLAKRVETRAPQVVQEYRVKLQQRLEKLLADSGVKLDDAALAREAANFADRCDVTEETTRLEHHCAQFLKGMAGKGEVGRKLDFIAQEMLRESNTIASKANDAELGSIAVEMKSEIEKIKEQVQNLE